jgi:hypothetical protein
VLIVNKWGAGTVVVAGTDRAMGIEAEISQARPEDTEVIVNIYLAARRASMPYLPDLQSDEETRAWFARRPKKFWVARCEGEIVGYMYLHERTPDQCWTTFISCPIGKGEALVFTSRQSKEPQSAADRTINIPAEY